MPMRLPVSLKVEFRGCKPERDYVIKETGEKRTAAPVLKFECDQEDGDVEVIEVTGSSFDRMVPAVDYSKFKKGDRFTLSGTAVIQDRGSDWDSYLSVVACVPTRAHTAAASG
ncbi:MAG: hypothetical protein ACJ76L_15330 [Conexibacter sp.]